MKLAPSHPDSLARRAWLGRCAALGACGASWPALAVAAVEGRLTRRIPSSGEALPVIGLGSWITFNVGNDSAARDACAEVVRAFFAGGGRVIDSSPMYGSAQPTIGHALARVGRPAGLFSAGGLARLLGRAALRFDAGARPAGVARALATPVRDEGGRAVAL